MMFSRTDSSADDALRLAILGREAEPQARGIARRRDAHGLAVDEGLPAIGALDAENELGRFRAAGAEKPREPHHLAGTDRQIERLHEAALAVILEGDERLAGRRLGAGCGAALPPRARGRASSTRARGAAVRKSGAIRRGGRCAAR